jgi:hypothetical protein
MPDHPDKQRHSASREQPPSAGDPGAELAPPPAASGHGTGERTPCGMDGRGVAWPTGRSGMLGTFRVGDAHRVGTAEARVGEVQIRLAECGANRSGSSPSDTTRRHGA